MEDSGRLGQGSILPKKMKELYADSYDDKDGGQAEEIPMAALLKLQVKRQKVESWTAVWTSKAALSRRDVSVWFPIHYGGMFSRNRVRICVGHYAAQGFGTPAKNVPPTQIS